MNKLSQNDLTKAVTQETGLHHHKVAEVLNSYADLVASNVHDGNSVPLPGLGHFKLNVSAPRLGRNPATGAEIQIPSKRHLKFSPSSRVKEALNG